MSKNNYMTEEEFDEEVENGTIPFVTYDEYKDAVDRMYEDFPEAYNDRY